MLAAGSLDAGADQLPFLVVAEIAVEMIDLALGDELEIGEGLLRGFQEALVGKLAQINSMAASGLKSFFLT